MKKVIWLKPHPKAAYFEGDICELPDEQAAELKKSKHIKDYEAPKPAEPIIDLPEDLPGRLALLAHGITKLSDIKQIKDFTEIKGIGKSTSSQILEFLKTAN